MAGNSPPKGPFHLSQPKVLSFESLKYVYFGDFSMTQLLTLPNAVQGGAPLREEEGRGGEDQEEVPRQGPCHR